jgi:cytochrome c peroxidase
MLNRPPSAAAAFKLSLCVLLASVLGACDGGGASVRDTAAASSSSSSGSATTSTLSAAAQLGQKIFSDMTLSVSGTQSCATCHVAQFAFASDPTPNGPDHGSPVPLGGPGMDLAGFRNTPSIMYASIIPAFYYDAGGNPYGGFFRDGRAKTLADQAALPFVTAFEMANSDAAAVIARLQTRPYLIDFEAIYGNVVLNDPATALQDMGAALAAFETEDPQFHPFSSKYDYFQAGQAQLTAQELRGLDKFNDPSKGNCAACHPSTSGDGVTPPMFTDFSYDNLGLPRNANIPANRDSAAPAYTPVDSTDGVHAYYDIGICGPFRDNGGLNLFGVCGQFKVPTLRNIALTAPYFHNGQFATLSDALGFYVRRDTNPEQFFPTTADGNVTKFDDLPAIYGGLFVVNIDTPASDASYVGNVNTLEIPYNRLIGDQPTLTQDDINDVIAFLCTLTDGYDPQNPTAQVLPAQCQAAISAAISALPARTVSP